MARMKEHIDISIDVPAGRSKKTSAKKHKKSARRPGGASTTKPSAKQIVAKKKKTTPAKKQESRKTETKKTAAAVKHHAPTTSARKNQGSTSERTPRRGFLASLFAPRSKSSTASGSLFRIKRPPYTNHTVDQLGDKDMMLSMEVPRSKKAIIYNMQVLHDEAIFVHAPDGEVVWEADLIEYPTFFKEEKYMKDQYDIAGLQRHLHSTGVLPKGAELKLRYRDESPHSPAHKRAPKHASYAYVIDINERGEYRAHVEDDNGKTVFVIDLDDYPEWFEDGWMKHADDIHGLLEYLIDMAIVPKTASLHREGSLRDGEAICLNSELGDRIPNPEHLRFADAVNAKFLRLKAVFGSAKPRAYPGGKHGIMVKRFIPTPTSVKNDELAKNYPIGMGPKGLDAYFKRNYDMTWNHFLTTPSEDLLKPMQAAFDAMAAKSVKKNVVSKRMVTAKSEQEELPARKRKRSVKRTKKVDPDETAKPRAVRKSVEKAPPVPIERKRRAKRPVVHEPAKANTGGSDSFDEKIAAIENLLKKALD